jgi:hypothetical protein
VRDRPAAGQSIKEILANIGASAGGSAALAWVIFVTTPQDTSDGNPPTNPPPPPPPPTSQPPETLPGVWDAPIDQAAQQILTLNPAAELTDVEAEEIAKRCAWLAAETGVALSDCGKEGLPIFLTGSDTPQSSQHDLEAILGLNGETPHPEWVSLNYVNKANQIGSRGWYRSDPRCASSSRPDKRDCDEFPFYSSAQGGSMAMPEPSLRVLPSGDNRSQGNKLRLFYGACGLQTGSPNSSGTAIVGGDRFLILPMPIGPPTLALCNGKTP